MQRYCNKETSPVTLLHKDSVIMPTESEMIEAQGNDPYCRNIISMVGVKPAWLYKEAGLLCRKAHTEGRVWVVVPRMYHIVVMYIGPFLKLARHAVVRWIYDSMRRQQYWHHMPSILLCHSISCVEGSDCRGSTTIAEFIHFAGTFGV